MASIGAALERIKQDPLGVLRRESIEQACHDAGYCWRNRELDPAVTIAVFVQQVVHGNAPCAEVCHLAGKSFTASAYCQARARVPLSVYQAVFADTIAASTPQTHKPDYLWRGHRTFHVDGSTGSMPDTPALRAAYGAPRGQRIGCGFPVCHLLVLFSAATGLLLDLFDSPLNTGDLAQSVEAHAHLDEGDILIGDDSFGSFAHLALLLQAKLHGLFPVYHARIVDFRPGRPFCTEGKNAVAGMARSRWIKRLGKDDQLVEWFKPGTRPLWMNPAQYDALPASIVVRELRRTVRRPGGGKVTLTMVTTLTDPVKYPAEALLELRLRRWDVETNIGHLKTTMKMDVLRCKTHEGVRKELTVFCIVYNLVRAVMLEAARRQEVPVSRISFVDALRWIRHAKPGDTLPPLVVNPHRPHRIEPRCRKRRPREYDLMNKPRSELRKRLKTERQNA
jgi:Transposase DDE domain